MTEKNDLVESDALRVHLSEISDLIDSVDASTKELVMYAVTRDPESCPIDRDRYDEYSDQLTTIIGTLLTDEMFPEILEDPSKFRMGDIFIIEDVEDAITRITGVINNYRDQSAFYGSKE